MLRKKINWFGEKGGKKKGKKIEVFKPGGGGGGGGGGEAFWR